MFRHLLVTICDHRSWHSETELVDGVLAYYGRDLTFSVPILMMCALAGIVTDWRRIPPFPFELATVIRANATTERHPFTGAPAGGWGWTNLSGSVPDGDDERNPVYGAATIADYLLSAGFSPQEAMVADALRFLLACQNGDGGWGGNKGVASKVTLTAKAITALGHADASAREALAGGVDFLWHHYEAGTLYRREPIGLYFSRLWYSEDLYSLTYLVTALRRISNYDF